MTRLQIKLKYIKLSIRKKENQIQFRGKLDMNEIKQIKEELKDLRTAETFVLNDIFSSYPNK